LGEALSGARFLHPHSRYVVYPSHTLAQLGTVLFYGALPWMMFLCVALLHSLRALWQRPPGLVPIYVLTSLLWAIPTAAGAGPAPNYLFQPYVPPRRASAAFLHGLRGRPQGEGGRIDRLAGALLSIQIVVCLALNPWIGLEHFLSIRRLWSNRDALMAALRSAPEPILVEDLGVAGYTGHRLFVD